VQNMVIESNAMAQAYQQIPPEVRQRWKASYDRYTAEQQPKPKQEEPRSWLAMLGEAQIQQAEAQRAMGKKIAEVGVQTGEEIWSGVKKTGNSFAEIGIDFWNGLEVRANKSLDSPYDFGNWLTVGAFDTVGAIVEGYKTRADMRNQSPYDYVNWLSSGMADTLKGAFNPDDPLSKEHWMNSFGVFTSVAGARGVVPKSGGPTLPKVNAKNPLPKIEERANQDVNKGPGEGVFDARKVQTVKLDENNLRLMSTRNIRNFKKEMGNKGIKVIVDRKGKIYKEYKIPPNVAAMFDNINGRIILRPNPRILDALHESYHANHWLDVGSQPYSVLKRLEREEFVYETIMKNKHLFTETEIYEAQRYIQFVRTGNWPLKDWKGLGE
ncbi:hypothetical protein AZ66_27510, partial [Paenibacillus sp. E194]|uniref:zincin-like metallopeptidase toxin domain-containing protein n=1 Tax=Paenibacillus sp. E194 TaxID=1458845 RepID=UPI0005E3C13F